MPIEQTKRVNTARTYGITAALLFGLSVPAQALTGEEVLTTLDTGEQYTYVTGVLEGLGYARFLKDRPDETGIKCINNWLLEDGTARWQIVKQWLDHHKEKPAGAILFAMISKECGQ